MTSGVDCLKCQDLSSKRKGRERPRLGKMEKLEPSSCKDSFKMLNVLENFHLVINVAFPGSACYI